MKIALPAVCVVLIALLGIAWAADGPSSMPKSPATQASRIDPAKEKDLRKLLGMLGWSQQASVIADNLVVHFQEAYPEVEPKFWEGMRKEIDSNVLFEMLVPVFAAHLDHEEIRAQITFFESPLGKKVADAQVPMMRDAQQVANKWGKYVVKMTLEKLRVHLLEPATKSASSGLPDRYGDSAEISTIQGRSRP
jgi:hypothetical protein